MTQIFISYAHDDHALLEKFLAALLPMTERIGITVWWDQELHAGQKWDARIRAALEESDVFLCFVTNAFLKPGGYIMKTELPAIRAAEASRHTLVLPVIAEPSHWIDDFGDTQAVPKTKKKALRPIVKWSPRSEGFHEASVQLKKPMLDFLNALPAKPDPGPGPAMAPTPKGFALVGRRPSESEQADPSLRGHHGDILDSLKQLEPFLDRLDNVDPQLVSAIRDYAAIASADFAALSLDRLWSLGSRLCERVETVARGDLAEIFDERTLRNVTGELNRLHNSHAVLIMGTEEGRALTARVVAYRSAPRPFAEAEGTALGVLTPMTRQHGLLEPATRTFVTKVTTPLVEGTERLDEIEAGLRTAVHAIAAFAAVLDPLLRDRPAEPADPTALRRRFAGDPNLDTILAAFAFIETNSAAVGTFARENADLRRYVERTLEALGGIRRAPLRDPGEPPPDFDEDEVREMVLRGEAPPRSWLPWVRNLVLTGTKVSDLSPIAGATGLQNLDLSVTEASDLSPIAGATGLQALYLSRTKVSDLSPIAGATELHTLDLSGTKVRDLSPIAGATRLQVLYLSETEVRDLSPIAGATGLHSLYLWETKVSDLSPIAGATGLQNLYLSATEVSDLSPIAGATGLQTLYLTATEVSDLSPIVGVTGLRTLDLSWTKVSDLSLLSAYPVLAILNTSRLERVVSWPTVWPSSLQQVNLRGSAWPEGQALPDAPWLIAPDGTVRCGEGEPPAPFKWWIEPLPNTPPSPAEG